MGPFKHAPVGFQFSYDLGDEPDEDDDEMNNTDGEGEEGEEEDQDDLIVEGEGEGEDEDVDHEDEETDSPALRRPHPVSDYSPSEKGQHASKVKGNFSPANRSVNMSQEEATT